MQRYHQFKTMHISKIFGTLLTTNFLAQFHPRLVFVQPVASFFLCHAANNYCFLGAQPIKLDLNKKLDSKQKNIQISILRLKGSEKQKMKIPRHGNKSNQLTSAGQSANHGQSGRHQLAGNSYFPRQRIFIFCFSEPLDINIESLNSLLLC